MEGPNNLMRFRTLGAVCATSAVAVPLTVFTESASAQEASTITPLTIPAAAQPPVSLHDGAVALASNRHVRTARRYHRLLGDPLELAERKELYAELRQITPFRIRVETRGVRGDIHRLRAKLRKRERERVRKRTGGAPNVPIPGALSSIASCESGGDPQAVSPGGRYRGKYQFSYSTWRSVGGSGDPAAASETEQDRRAAVLYRTGGPGHWPVCGR
jgi:hypothetical protein